MDFKSLTKNDFFLIITSIVVCLLQTACKSDQMKTIQFQTTYSSPEIDSTDLRIYEFMELAVNFLGLDRSQRLEIKPATNCNYNAEDSIFLKENLLLVPEEELAKRGNMYAISYPSKCLTTADIEYMLAQKKETVHFNWTPEN